MMTWKRTQLTSNNDKEEDPTVSDKLEGYKIYFHYLPKINCTKKEMLNFKL